jgi:hypothetical protein
LNLAKRQLTSACLLPVFIATAWAQSASAPKYSADVPSNITTPDSVATRLGTLKFNNGVPDERTIQLVYDQIDFARGIEAFLTGMPQSPFMQSARASSASVSNEIKVWGSPRT